MSTKVTIDNKMKQSKFSILDGIACKEEKGYEEIQPSNKNKAGLSESEDDDDGDSEVMSAEEGDSGDEGMSEEENVEDFMDLEAEEGPEEDESGDDESGDDESGEDESSDDDESTRSDDGFIIEQCKETVHKKRRVPVIMESDSDEESVEEEVLEEEGEESVEEEEQSTEEEEGSDDVTSDLKWKTNLKEKAMKSFEQRRSRSSHLKSLIYGKAGAVEKEDSLENKDELGGLFHVRVESKSQYSMLDTTLNNNNDLQLDWCSESVIESVKTLFVTGSWGEDDAKKLLEEDEENGEEDLFGDFEDLETGEVHKQTMGEGEGEENEEKRKKKKEELKKAFDREYDNEQEEVIYYNCNSKDC